MKWRTAIAAAALALAWTPAAAGQPVPMPEVVAETPARPHSVVPAAAGVSTSSARAPAAATAVEASEALARTG